MVAIDLHTRVLAMRDEFARILDEEGPELDNELRVKMAKAELILNKIGRLLQGEHTDTGGIE